MGLFKKSKPKSQYDEAYLELRAQAFGAKPQVRLSNNEQCYAAVIDLPTHSGVATLFCTFEQHVSLYYSNGGGALGINENNEEVAKAGGSLCFSAGQVIHYATKTENFEINPENIVAFIFVQQGIYRLEIPNNIEKADKPYQFMNFLIQNVLTAYRNVQER